MYKQDLISFRRRDSVPRFIEGVIREIADHFKVQRKYLHQFCDLIRVSGRWDMDNIKIKLSEWKRVFEKIQGTKAITRIVCSGFLKCKTYKHIHKLRGLMLEALIIGCYGGSEVLNKPEFGWGAEVVLNFDDKSKTQAIKYICTQFCTEYCRNRSTVDFGYWNGDHGKFYECKVNPNNIGCKETQYMKTLSKELKRYNIDHETFFVCADSHEEVEMKLSDLGFDPKVKPVGVEDIKKMVPA